MDSDSAASEYRLDIKGISVFCPCGKFLWLYDDGSIFKLSRHLKICEIYKNKKGLPLTNIVNQSLMSMKVEQEDFVCTKSKYYFCEKTQCRFNKYPFKDERSSIKHNRKCGGGILTEHAYYHKAYPQGLIRKKLTLDTRSRVCDVDLEEEIAMVTKIQLPNPVLLSSITKYAQGKDGYQRLVFKYLSKFNNSQEFENHICSAINSYTFGNYSILINKYLDELPTIVELCPTVYKVMVMNMAKENSNLEYGMFNLPNLSRVKGELQKMIPFIICQNSGFQEITSRLIPCIIIKSKLLEEFTISRCFTLMQGDLKFRSFESIKQSYYTIVCIIRSSIISYVYYMNNNGKTEKEIKEFVSGITNSEWFNDICGNLNNLRSAAQANVCLTKGFFNSVSKDILIDEVTFRYETYSKLSIKLIDKILGIFAKIGYEFHENALQALKSKSITKLRFNIDHLETEEALNIYHQLVPIISSLLYSVGGGATRGVEVQRILMEDCRFTNSKFSFEVISRKTATYGANTFGKHYMHTLDCYLSLIMQIFIVGVRNQIANILPNENTKYLIIFERNQEGDIDSLNNQIKAVLNTLLNVNVLNIYSFRHFFAEVTNNIYSILGEQSEDGLVNASLAYSMGHSVTTHAMHYNSSVQLKSQEYYHRVFNNNYGYEFKEERNSIANVTSEHINKALKLLYGEFAEFRGKQEELINTTINDQQSHSFFALSTGVGKSICWLLPHVAYREAGYLCGSCAILVISPYKALNSMHYYTAREKLKKFPDIRIHNLENSSDLSVLQCANLIFASVSALSMQKMSILAAFLKTIVLDECHTVVSDSAYREDFQILKRLSTFCIPIILLSGSAQGGIAEVVLDILNLKSVNIIHSDTDLLSPKVELSNEFFYDNPYRQLIELINKCSPYVHVFVNSKIEAYQIGPNIVDCEVLTSEIEINTQNDIMDRWIQGKINVLISTSCANSGVNNIHLKTVIFFGTPMHLLYYQQGIGRIRGKGKAIVCSYSDENKFESQVYDIMKVCDNSKESIIKKWFSYESAKSFFSDNVCRKALFHFYATNRRINPCVNSCDVCCRSNIAKSAEASNNAFAKRQKLINESTEIGRKLLNISYSMCLVCKSKGKCSCISHVACYKCARLGHSANDSNCSIKSNIQLIFGKGKICYFCYRWTLNNHDKHPPGKECLNKTNRNYFKSFLKYVGEGSTQGKSITEEVLRNLYWQGDKQLSNENDVLFRLGQMYQKSGLNILE